MDNRAEKLSKIREVAGERQTRGIDDRDIERFLVNDPTLAMAIDSAAEMHARLMSEHPDWLAMEEAALCRLTQEKILNFYPDDGINPYVALGAAGPWIVTTHGAVLHDSGGYGMLGMGHAPSEVAEALAGSWVMANVMTPSVSQKRFTDRLEREIGHTRADGCPFSRFICLNSGSESVTIAARLCDINARRQTDPGGRHAGKPIRQLALEEGFHGRTLWPARISHSTRAIYKAKLASFRDRDDLDVVPPNDIAALEKAFARAEAEGFFYEALFVEPVMGEGQPGLGLTRAFYDRARALTREHSALFVVDSIQAALRAHGCLSIVDYPGFADCEPPDLETYSKALNAGQFPLSVLAMTQPSADLYVKGVYGNTMTTNPRALEVGAAVLDAVSGDLRANIRKRGAEFKTALEGLARANPDVFTQVLGTGLILCAEVDPDRFQVTGAGGLEERLRRAGIEMIHGGQNGLRFTPHFAITSEEISLIVDTLYRVIGQALAGDDLGDGAHTNRQPESHA